MQVNEEYTVIAGKERWTRSTRNGACGLADNLAKRGTPAKVYGTTTLIEFPDDATPLYEGKTE